MNMRRMIAIAVLLSLATAAQAQTLVHPAPGKKARGSFWKASVAALAAAAAADAQTSVGRRELNPLLAGPGGRFGMRGIAIKGAITGGAIGMQYLLTRRNPASAKYAAAANFGMTGIFSAAAMHNRGLKKPQR